MYESPSVANTDDLSVSSDDNRAPAIGMLDSGIHHTIVVTNSFPWRVVGFVIRRKRFTVRTYLLLLTWASVGAAAMGLANKYNNDAFGMVGYLVLAGTCGASLASVFRFRISSLIAIAILLAIIPIVAMAVVVGIRNHW